jgi:hypothetical protein
VVWLAPEASGDEVDRIRRFYGDPAVGDRVIVAPYSYPEEGEAGRLPNGARMALVAWHYVELCDEANLAAAFHFTARYAAPTFDGRPSLGEAREPGAPI